MIKYALFDFDGTLFDSNGIYEGLGKQYIQHLGLVPNDDIDEDLKTLSLYEGAKYLKEHYLLHQSIDIIQEEIQVLIGDKYKKEIQPKKRTRDFLDWLKKKHVKMAIVSASHKEGIQAALKRCQLDSYFEEIVTCEMVGEGKNSPAIYDEALKRLHGKKEETYVFEDALHAIQTCIKAGYVVVGVYDRFEKNQEEVKKIVSSYIRLDD